MVVVQEREQVTAITMSGPPPRMAYCPGGQRSLISVATMKMARIVVATHQLYLSMVKQKKSKCSKTIHSQLRLWLVATNQGSSRERLKNTANNPSCAKVL